MVSTCRVFDEKLSFHPHLPRGVRKLFIKSLDYRGAELSVYAGRENTKIVFTKIRTPLAVRQLEQVFHVRKPRTLKILQEKFDIFHSLNQH